MGSQHEKIITTVIEPNEFENLELGHGLRKEE
jgi:hypothetical protein